MLSRLPLECEVGESAVLLGADGSNPGALWEFTQGFGSHLKQKSKFIMRLNCVAGSSLNLRLYSHREKSLTTRVYTDLFFLWRSTTCSRTYCTNLTLMATDMVVYSLVAFLCLVVTLEPVQTQRGAA